MMNLLGNYLKEYGLDRPGMGHHPPLFFNSRRAKLTNPGITYILQNMLHWHILHIPIWSRQHQLRIR